MAKVTYSKLSLKEKKDIITIHIGENEVEVKQYLPVNDKLKVIENVINQANDGNNFANPVKLDMFLALEIIFNYTNIGFTEKQKEDLLKIYDTLNSNGVIESVYDAIPAEELKTLIDGVYDSVNFIYEYHNSLRGIMEDVSTNYSETAFDAEKIRQDLADPDNLALLKNVAKKLG